MKKLKIHLENCYGIKKLETEIDLTKKRVCAIYAPNGSMKTSFAKTFKNISEGSEPKDEIYGETATWKITDETGANLKKESVFVILPLDKTFKSQKISRLLANQALRDEYARIHEKIDEKKGQLLKKLKTYSGLKKEDIEATLADDVTHDKKLFLLSLAQLQPRVAEEKEPLFGDIPYKEVFNDTVVSLLQSSDFKTKLSEYIDVYDTLLSNSNFFKKGMFNHTNATTVAKNLKANKFFKANHSLFINTKDGRKEVKTEGELEGAIQAEMDTILTDEKLSSAWTEVDSKLTNQTLQGFREFLSNHKGIIPELENLPRFKQKLWVSYLALSTAEYKDLLSTYDESKKEITAIMETAKSEKTKWDGVINKFNERFSVPFRVEVDNQHDVILREEAPAFKFVFKGDGEKPDKTIAEGRLWDILSNGETRALYLLNIIYEINARKEDNAETIFIIDDIADSFDYKNKYAIIEYLMEVSLVPNFYQIILTHNFDFFRTIESRYVGYGQCHMTYKLEKEVILKPAQWIRDPFKHWKPAFSSDPKKRLATIPFIRNILQYTKGLKDPDYLKLTSLLHWREDTANISEEDLSNIFNKVFTDIQVSKGSDKKVFELIEEQAAECMAAPEGANLENKIILSIAIRIKAEKFMIDKINDKRLTSGIAGEQTTKLFDLFKEKFAQELQNRDILEKVILMTPENIHLNSFMYEPILDMSDTHLKNLFTVVNAMH